MGVQWIVPNRPLILPTSSSIRFFILIVCDADSGGDNQHDQRYLAHHSGFVSSMASKPCNGGGYPWSNLVGRPKGRFWNLQTPFQLFLFFLNFRKVRASWNFWKSIPWERPRPLRATPALSCPFCAVAEYALNASEKVSSVIVRVKPDKIRAKQSLQKCPAPFPWNQSKNLKLRERNM